MGKKICLLSLPLCVLFFTEVAFSDVNPEAKKRLAKPTTDQASEYSKRAHDVGRFKLPVSNYGVHGQHLTAVSSGGEWPNGSRDYYIFGAGIWIAAKVNGEKRCAVGYNPNSADFEMYPGTLPNEPGTYDKSNPYEKNPTEILYLSTDGADLAHWPLRNPDGTPAIVSIQDSYAIYNDMESSRTFSTEKPLGIQVIQRGYAWNYTANQDIVFLVFDLVNITNDPNYPAAAAKFPKDTPAPPPNTTLEDVYFGPCVDADIGNAVDDMVDFDASRNLGIVWDFDGKEANFDLDLNGDGQIGDTGVLGYDFLESPLATKYVDANGNGKIDTLADGKIDSTAVVVYNGVPVVDRAPGQQLGLTAFKKFELQIDPRTDENRYDMMAGYDYRTMIPGGDSLYVPFDKDFAPEDKRFVQVAGPFDLAPGDTVRCVVAIMVAANVEELKKMSDLAQAIYDANYFLPFPPKVAKLEAVEGDRQITLLWDDSPEQAEDPFAAVALDPTSLFYDPKYVAKDFQGYRVYRSLTGISGSWVLLAEYDKADGHTTRIDTVVQQGLNIPVIVNIGKDTGLKHSYVDTDVKNGIAYFYAVTSYDFQPFSKPITLESALTNQIVAVPRAEQAGYSPPEILEIKHSAGVSDGEVEAKLINPLKITGHTYEVSFTDTMLPPIDPSKLTSRRFWHVRDQDTKDYVLKNQTHFGVWGVAGEPLDTDGMLFKVSGPDKRTLSMSKVQGQGVGAVLGVVPWRKNDEKHNNYRDFEIRFSGWTNAQGDTLNYGIEYTAGPNPAPTKKPCPFEFWDIGSFTDKNGDGKDDDPTDDVRLWPVWAKGSPLRFILDKNSPNTKYAEDFLALPEHNLPAYWTRSADPVSQYDWDYMINDDKNNLSVNPAEAEPKWSKRDVWRIVNLMPIVLGEKGDKWTITTKAITITKTPEALKEIRVVPNPFIIANEYMRDPAFKEIHFTHLPAQCTIRIFTVAGDLIKTLKHDQPGIASDGYEPWNLLSENDQLIASGVYIYHVEAPGYGETVGKFAVIVK